MAITLNPLQIVQLKKSWSVLAPNPSHLASAVVIRLFKENPEYQILFKRLRGLSLDELESHPQFQTHASKVGAALGSTIDLLDKPEELEELLTKVGMKHKKYGLTPKHFQDLGGVLVSLIAEEIGDSDPDLLDLWKSSLTSVMSVVIAGCF